MASTTASDIATASNPPTTLAEGIESLLGALRGNEATIRYLSDALFINTVKTPKPPMDMKTYESLVQQVCSLRETVASQFKTFLSYREQMKTSKSQSESKDEGHEKSELSRKESSSMDTLKYLLKEQVRVTSSYLVELKKYLNPDEVSYTRLAGIMSTFEGANKEHNPLPKLASQIWREKREAAQLREDRAALARFLAGPPDMTMEEALKGTSSSVGPDAPEQEPSEEELMPLLRANSAALERFMAGPPDMTVKEALYGPSS